MTMFFPSRFNIGRGKKNQTWTEVFTIPSGTMTNSYNWNTTTLVQLVPLAAFSQTGGSQIRLTIKGPVTGSGEACEFGALWVGNGGGGNAYDFTGDQVRLQLSGSDTINIPVNGTITTDGAAFVKDGVNDLVVAYHWGNASADAIYLLTTNTYGQQYYKPATPADAGTQDKSGYSTYGNNLAIMKIELLI